MLNEEKEYAWEDFYGSCGQLTETAKERFKLYTEKSKWDTSPRILYETDPYVGDADETIFDFKGSSELYKITCYEITVDSNGNYKDRDYCEGQLWKWSDQAGWLLLIDQRGICDELIEHSLMEYAYLFYALLNDVDEIIS